MQINPNVFRMNDIRGLVDRDLSDEFAYKLGHAFAKIAKTYSIKKIAIGWDCRTKSEDYAMMLIKAISEAGIDSKVIGLCPTPQLYWALFNSDCEGGIEVTGSHNAVNMNGFKLCIGKEAVSGEVISRIKELMLGEESELITKEVSVGKIAYLTCRDNYLQDIVSRINLGSRKLKVVVDAGNGVGGLTGPKALRALGVDVLEIFCDPDGTFPNHHPDPSVEKNLDFLKEKVILEKADLGIAWDGDGDRIAVVDEKGKIIYADELILLYAKNILQEQPHATVVADVKCSDMLIKEVEALGGKTVLWHSGHSLMKKKIHELNAEIGGEFSGHIFFNHRYYGFDDGAYGACRLIEILSKTEKKLSELFSEFPFKYSTPELRIPCSDDCKFLVVESLKEKLKGFPYLDIDGVRIQFEQGWGLVRASNTEAALTVRAEADSIELLSQYRSFIEGLIGEIQEQAI